MEAKRKFDPNEDKWKSKTYYLKFQDKKFYVAKFLFKVRQLPTRPIRFLFLWMKDMETPGNPVMYAQLCIADFTTYLKRFVSQSKEWRSRTYRAIHRGNVMGKFQFFLNFKKEKPHFVLKYTENTEYGAVSYFTRLSVADFMKLNDCVLSLGKPPRHRDKLL